MNTSFCQQPHAHHPEASDLEPKDEDFSPDLIEDTIEEPEPQLEELITHDHNEDQEEEILSPSVNGDNNSESNSDQHTV